MKLAEEQLRYLVTNSGRPLEELQAWVGIFENMPDSKPKPEDNKEDQAPTHNEEDTNKIKELSDKLSEAETKLKETEGKLEEAQAANIRQDQSGNAANTKEAAFEAVRELFRRS